MTTRDAIARPGDNSVYVPGHGDTRYRVLRYDIELEVKLAGNHLEARATLTACPTAGRLDAFTLDLHRLKVGKVTVNGKPPARRTHRGDRLTITPRQPIPAGEEFTVAIQYSGNPSQVKGIDGLAGWEELTDGLIVASQPHGAPSWFPCNDRPGDKAAYRLTVTTDNDYQVVANGALVETRRRSSRTTWVYDQREPMAAYLATLQIGRYATHDLLDSPVPIRLHFPPGLRRKVTEGPLMAQARMMRTFTHLFGPYPFARYDIVVTQDELEIPLEAQTLSIFGSNYLASDWENERLVAHELAHQWFGNSVTVDQWRDIWLHEGFACYAEWLWSQVSGGPSARQRAREHHAGLAAKAQDFALADPTPELMFDDRVYKRGACLLHDLREHLGDTAFFGLLRRWCDTHRYGVVGSEDFVRLAAIHADVPASWFDPWLHDHALPHPDWAA